MCFEVYVFPGTRSIKEIESVRLINNLDGNRYQALVNNNIMFSLIAFSADMTAGVHTQKRNSFVVFAYDRGQYCGLRQTITSESGF